MNVTQDPAPSGHVAPPGAAFMNTVRWVLFGGLTLLALVSIASWVAWRAGEGRTARSTSGGQAGVAEFYRCPMHPSYTSDKPGDWTGLVGMVEKSEQDELRQLLVASRQQKELHLRLVYQQRYRNILDFWLYLHIPLSVAMIVLIFAHVWGVFYYGVVKF